MILGFDAKRLFLNRSGLGNYSRWLLSGLVERHPDQQYHLYTPALSEFKDQFVKPGVHFHLPPTIFSTFWRSKGIKKDLLKDGIEVYHGLSNELPLGIEKTGIKSVVTIHDLIFLTHPEYYTPIDRSIYIRKFRSACERADRIVAISEHTKSDIIHYFNTDPEKIEVIYMDAPPGLGHTIKIKEGENHPGRPYFLCVGTIGGRKNQFRLLEAFESIHRSVDMDLVLAGKPGKEDHHFRDMIKKAGLENRVHMKGQITDTELWDLYKNSYATVYPSLYEGFGIPILESFRCGKPVLTSRGSSMEEICGKAGLLCDPLDAASIAEQLRALSNSENYYRLQKAIPDELSRFLPENTIDRYMSLYQSIM